MFAVKTVIIPLKQKRTQFQHKPLQKIKKEYSKEVKKAAAMAAVANFLKAKKAVQNQLGNTSGEISGDLVNDGAGFIKVIVQNLMEALKTEIKKLAISVFTSILGFLVSIISSMLRYL